MLEAHHLDKDQHAGHPIHISDKPNPRFYSTMISHMQKHGLDKGRAVRVVSHKDSILSKRYKSIVDKLCKKHGYRAFKGVDHTLGHDMDKIYIHPSSYRIGLSENFGGNLSERK
jgi:hypothetical protein